MSTRTRALTVQRLLQQSAALRMLRMDSLPLAAAVLGEFLGAPNAQMPTQDLHEQLDIELESLRAHLPIGNQTARALCDAWRQAGLLRRRPVADARGEVYELTSEARQSLRMLEQVEQPRAAATESRLVSLMRDLHQLTIDTDPNVATRLTALEQQRAELDAQIQRVRAGEEGVLDERRALERLEDLLAHAEDLPADFARVRTRFEEINEDLRVSILTQEDRPGGVLDEVFRGVDLIASSDEGQTFAAFARMARDPELSAEFDDDVRTILHRDVVAGLSTDSRRALREMTRTLKDGSRTVQDALTQFARGLRRYVLSQEYQRDRRLRRDLQEALAAAVPAAQTVKPYQDVGRSLELTSMRMSSLGAIALHDPTEMDTGPELEEDRAEAGDFEELRALARLTEIDFHELEANVRAVLAEQETATVGAVLDQFPATQGVASVVGLLSLAARYGTIDEDATEDLRWEDASGTLRTAPVTVHTFTARSTL